MINQLEEKIGLKFKNKKILNLALTHRSYINEHRKENLASNERLEFLGDAVLELWTTQQLFNRFPLLPEGVLTNIIAALVRTESLAQIGTDLGIGKYLLLSKGEANGGGRRNSSLLADTFEAIVGAIYLDQSWPGVDQFLERNLLGRLVQLGEKGDIKDAKTQLQEVVQAKLKLTPHYKIVDEEGPDHDKSFTTAVFFGQKKIGIGKGPSKKEAEENAAEKALTQVKEKTIIP